MKSLLGKAIRVILVLTEDTDFICDEIHSNGGCEWCEQNCGDRIKPDYKCVLEYLKNHYNEN